MEDKLHLMTTILKVTDFHEKRSTVHKRMHYNVSVGLCHALVDLKRNSWEARMEASLELHGANKNCNDKIMIYPLQGVVFCRFCNSRCREL